MVDKLHIPKIETQKCLSTTSREKSIFSHTTTMDSDHGKCPTRSKSESRESRIGNKITKSFLEREKNYLKNPNDYDRIIEVNSKYILNYKESCSNSNDESKEEILNETIQVNILINIDGDEYLKSVNAIITNKVSIGDLLRESIKLFNKLFEKENSPIRLIYTKLSNYEMKPSKKNGKPNKDLPSKLYSVNIKILGFNLISLVCDTNLKKFSIVYEYPDLLLHKDRRNFFFKCNKCSIF